MKKKLELNANKTEVLWIRRKLGIGIGSVMDGVAFPQKKQFSEHLLFILATLLNASTYD